VGVAVFSGFDVAVLGAKIEEWVFERVDGEMTEAVDVR